MFQNTFLGFQIALALLTDSNLKANVAGEVTTAELEERRRAAKTHLSTALNSKSCSPVLQLVQRMMLPDRSSLERASQVSDLVRACWQNP